MNYNNRGKIMEKGQRLNVKIEKLSLGGDGIARVSNFVVFVPYSAPGDELGVEIVEKKKNFAHGQILKILKGGESRVEPPCPYYFKTQMPLWCGGCNFQHLKYEAQISQKTAVLKESLEKIEGLSCFALLPALSANSDFEWR